MDVMMISSVPDSVNYESLSFPLPPRQRWDPPVKAVKRRPVTEKKKIKRRRRDVDDVDIIAKRLRAEHSSTTDHIDVFTNLPECLKLHILSLLEVKYAVRTSALSKTWKPLWTSIPTLNLDSTSDGFERLNIFDKFVHKRLSFRSDRAMKLDRLSFTRHGVSSAEILETVFSYALSQDVREVESWINSSKNGSWPNCLKNSSSNSLKSLKLGSNDYLSCPLLGPNSDHTFKNLGILSLERVFIYDLQPFSRFPFLEKLTLNECSIETKGRILNIHALKLLELQVSCNESIDRLELVTPNLKSFKYRTYNFPQLETPQGGLDVLQTVVLDYHDSGLDEYDKEDFENLLSLFSGVCSTKSLSLFPAVVELLSLFKDELGERCSPPFKDLKFFMVDYSGRCSSSRSKEIIRPCAKITNYLLKNCECSVLKRF
ncbi:putative F-box/FBD/LRR-repeat protein At4g03220 [Rutidosis leptorrhynchoides]|uniref:putative F-box/FBD/LRR-repeat protein At4g03220 n=1 Tax=Rutidosis leptorrhynchoides TaxID=125765 RepID=UPI003A9A12FF